MKHIKHISEMEGKSIPDISYLDEVNNYLLDLKDLGCVCEIHEFYFKEGGKMQPWSENPVHYNCPEEYFSSNNLDAKRSYMIRVKFIFSTLEINSEISQEVLILKNRMMDKFKNSKSYVDLNPDHDEYDSGEQYNMIYQILIITKEELRKSKNTISKSIVQ